jgi:hypothetical protein
MVCVKGDKLLDFDFIHALQNRQSMSHTVNAHFLQLFMLQSNQGFANNRIFCAIGYRQ